ncbi:MAG: transporter [Terracidiphilus sp.]|nr:transporter [Terracidiphilus sp.]
MNFPRGAFRLLILLLLVLAVPRLYAQGPPFQTDDPVPVDFGHYEFYVFGSMDGTPVALGSVSPAFEFNWGALPRLQIHAILPWGASAPLNSKIYDPAGQGPDAFGLTDMEIGAKVALIKESKFVPQIGTFTMIELPTGDDTRGLGVGKAWYKLPLWLQKNSGKWLFDGGAGYALNSQEGFRNFAYTGWLVKRQFSNRLELGAEIFSHGSEGEAAAQTRRSTMADIGMYYHFKNPDHQLLAAYGHAIAGQTENYAYLGLYWTWGKGDKPAAEARLAPLQPLNRAF